MFTCGQLGCDGGNRCIGRHARSQSRHLSFASCIRTAYILLDPVVDYWLILLFLSVSE